MYVTVLIGHVCEYTKSGLINSNNWVRNKDIDLKTLTTVEYAPMIQLYHF